MSEFEQQFFTPLDRSEKTGLGSETETIAFWSDVWRRFRRFGLAPECRFLSGLFPRLAKW